MLSQTLSECEITSERGQRFVVRMAAGGGDQRERTADRVQRVSGARPVRVHQRIALGRIVVEQANGQIVHDGGGRRRRIRRCRRRRSGIGRIHRRWRARRQRTNAGRWLRGRSGRPGGGHVISIRCTGAEGSRRRRRLR